MEAFPHDWKAEGRFTREVNAFEQTFRAVQSNLRVLANLENELALFDIAAFVEQWGGNGR